MILSATIYGVNRNQTAKMKSILTKMTVRNESSRIKQYQAAKARLNLLDDNGFTEEQAKLYK
ncbi:hypothetical protein PDUR_23630 [Paenibacillus durus]|uniref:Uncharacterized protein n=1 Tax=Paenibacillus durus TaxID=44251 RepID=A0A089HUV5_PAEDU|nr:hypothetical protein PDUR_23630 [Paenibacillus durus]